MAQFRAPTPPLRQPLRLIYIAALSAAFALCYAGWYVLRPIPAAALPFAFDIPAGTSLRAAARHLERSGLPVGAMRFELLARSLGSTQQIQAGSYELTEPITPLALLRRLTRGDAMQSAIQLIEGWNIRQVRAALAAHPDLKHDAARLADADLLGALGGTGAHPEGMFFPDTYLFPKGVSELSILRRAHRALNERLAQAWEARAPSLAYRSPYEALIMASIIEKETGRPEDRAQIAGVLTNRLRIGMRLQADPTVIYGLGESYDGNLKRGHLLRDGPYNTYTRSGLPPTPIAMPGLASIRAAMQPEKTNSLYYVGRGDGTSSFSRNLSEHNRAVSRYQRATGKPAQRRDRKGASSEPGS